MKTSTPRTDAECKRAAYRFCDAPDANIWINADFARELERDAWRKINPDDAGTMPDLGQLCLLYDPAKGPFIGSRDDVQGDGWLWGQAYGCPWHNGEKWDEDVMQDDDYHVTHWLPLPSLPNAPHHAETADAKESK